MGKGTRQGSRGVSRRPLKCLGLVGVLLAGWALAGAASAAAAADRLDAPPLALGHPWVGLAWPVEQEPEQRWERDLAEMEGAHLSAARVGDHAWSRLEPREGQYDFDWLLRAIRLAGRHHLEILIRSPLGTPPPWLSPPAASADQTSAAELASKVRERGLALLDQLAQALGHEGNVLGWELAAPDPPSPTDPATRAQLTQWLQPRYATLAALNDTWGVKGADAYASWKDIARRPLPATPGCRTDWQRFVAQTMRDQHEAQIRAIRAHGNRAQVIAASITGEAGAGTRDADATAPDADVLVFTANLEEEHLHPQALAVESDTVRSWKGRGFWLNETAPVPNAAQEPLAPGELRALAWEAIGHGADGLIYDPARSTADLEGSVLGLPAFARELRLLARELRLASPALRDTAPRARVTILVSHASEDSLARCPGSYDREQMQQYFYRALSQLTQSLDIVDTAAPLERYSLVVAPAPGMITEQLEQRLTEHIRRGGHVLLGPRAGLAQAAPPPGHGPLSAVLGRLEGCHGLSERVPLKSPGGSGSASIWGEDLSGRAAAASVILRYGVSDSPLSGKPAAVLRRYGRGSITYLGALPDPALMSALLHRSLAKSGALSRFGPLPPDVELLPRLAHHREALIFINHGEVPRSLLLPSRMRDVLTGSGKVRTISLPAQGVAVLEPARSLAP